MNSITKKILALGMILFANFAFAQQTIFGKITNQQNKPIANVVVSVEGTDISTNSKADGSYRIPNLEKGTYTLLFDFPNGEFSDETIQIKNSDVQFDYKSLDSYSLGTVEIFGERNKKQRGIEQITRFPVNINDQIQSISVVSEKLIEDQGALTVTDAARNVAGVTQFASYGGTRESMSIRGFRGAPILKNGVRMDSDFRSAAGISDMSGVESIQVIKGSASLTQGVGDDLGSAGGVINVVTKTPRYTNSAEIGVRSGSWWRSRMQYDAQTVFGSNHNVGLRIAGAFQAGESYKDKVKNNRVYVAPSFAWKPDSKTEVILEMDYLKDNSTPDRGSINLAPDTEEALYEMGHKFTGYKDDNQEIENLTYSATVTRNLAKKLDARVGYFNSYYENDTQGATLGIFKDSNGDIVYNKRNRGIGRSFRNDRNSTIQIDLMGKNMEFGIIKWSWQLGYDYSMSRVDTRSAEGMKSIDVIDVYQPINNSNVTSFANFDPTKVELGESNLTHTYYYGFVTQHHIAFTDYLKLVGGVRYSYSIANSESVIDPMIGLMVTPIKNINLFGSYTTTSSLRTANNPLSDGGTVGVSRTKQYEFGVKSNWLKDRLRATVTYFDMNNENLAYQLYDENQTPTEFYGLAGNLKRKGVEVEVVGRPAHNLQIMLGYAYLDAFYENSPAYMDGSRPMNAPTNTANAWVHYQFPENMLKGFSVGAGLYFVGERPANEYTKITAVHNTTPGVKYFDMPGYTTLNAQFGYDLNRVNFRLFLNNITDAIGYNSYYRGGFINQIDPFNVSAQVNFKF
jgi:iron complex outermembrane receptor protein